MFIMVYLDMSGLDIKDFDLLVGWMCLLSWVAHQLQPIIDSPLTLDSCTFAIGESIPLFAKEK